VTRRATFPVVSRARTALAWVVVLPWAAWTVVRAGGWEAGSRGSR
jgi:hypothetical protein